MINFSLKYLCVNEQCQEQFHFFCQGCLINNLHITHTIIDLPQLIDIMNQYDTLIKQQHEIYSQFTQQISQQHIWREYLNQYYNQHLKKYLYNEISDIIFLLQNDKYEQINKSQRQVIKNINKNRIFYQTLFFTKININALNSRIILIDNQQINNKYCYQSNEQIKNFFEFYFADNNKSNLLDTTQFQGKYSEQIFIKTSINYILVLNKQLCAFGSDNQQVQIWDITKKKNKGNCRGHIQSVWALHKINEKLLASGSNDNKIRIWNYNKLQCIKLFNWHYKWIQYFLTIEHNLFASISDDTIVTIWQYWSGKIVYQINTQHDNQVFSGLIISPSKLVTASCDGTLKCWNLLNQQKYKQLTFNCEIYSLLKLSNNLFAVGGYDGKIYIIDSNNIIISNVIQQHISNQWIVQMKLLDDQHICSICTDKNISIVNYLQPNKQKQLIKHTDRGLCIAIYRGKYLLSGGDDKRIIVWK